MSADEILAPLDAWLDTAWPDGAPTIVAREAARWLRAALCGPRAYGAELVLQALLEDRIRRRRA